MASTDQAFEYLLDSWQWVGVFLHVGIETVEVYAKWWLLSFFQTSTTVINHALWLGWIAPESSISHRCAWTSSTNCIGIHLNCSLNGASSVTLITCLVKWVQLSLQCSKEKMSWYSARRARAKILSHSILTFQTDFPTSVLQSTSVSGCLGLIQCIYHSRPHLWLWHLIGSYYPCHQNLFLQSLRVCHTVSHYASDILAAIGHFSVSVLYHQTLGQWPFFST